MSSKTDVLCWKCEKKVGELPLKVRFREECPHCGIDLHVCKNCKYFAPGKPNDCSVPGTDPIRDREAQNFCEEFKLKTPHEKDASFDRAKEIFGLHKEPPKKDFNSLFKDDSF